MNPKLAPFAQTMEIARVLTDRSLEGFSETEIHIRINDISNSMLWIFGHIVQTRYLLARQIGLDMSWSDGAPFDRGADILPVDQYPDLVEIMLAWDNISEAINKRLPELTDDDLAAELGFPLPVEEKTILTGISFLVWHESYHVGQLAYIRRLLGQDQLVG